MRPVALDTDGMRPHGEKRQTIGIDRDRFHAQVICGKRSLPSLGKILRILRVGIRFGNNPSTKELIRSSRPMWNHIVTFHSLRDYSVPSNDAVS